MSHRCPSTAAACVVDAAATREDRLIELLESKLQKEQAKADELQSMQTKQASNEKQCETFGKELLVHMEKVKQTRACLDHARRQGLRQRIAAASQSHASTNDKQHSREVEADDPHEHTHSMPTTKTATSAFKRP